MSGRSASVEKHILDLFRDQNKPFNVQVVADFLAQYGIKKAQVQKALDQLAEKQKIVVKEFGKTKIFWPLQSQDDVLSKEDLEMRKKELVELKASVQQQADDIDRLTREHSALKASLAPEEIDKEIDALSSKVTLLHRLSHSLMQKDALLQKLVKLRESAVVVSPEDRTKSEKLLETNLRYWKKWKAAFKEIWGSLSETIDRKTSELFEEIGIDIDKQDGETMESLTRLTGNKRRRRDNA